MVIIGIVGHPSSGKDTVSDYLVKKSFYHISSGDTLRTEMKKLNLPIDRPSVRQFVTNKRKEVGAFYPVNLFIDQIRDHTVISGFRNLAETQYIKDRYKDSFILIAVTASIEARYKRALLRNREGDNISFIDFKAHEEAERNADPESHELDLVLAKADYMIDNNGTLEDLHDKIDELLEKLMSV